MNPNPPGKDHDPQRDTNRMLNQVAGAFALPWPRKPLSGGGKGAPGKGAPAKAAARSGARRAGPRNHKRRNAA